MAIITEADFRAATVAEYCYDIQMEVAVAPAASLTATIARMTSKFSEYTNDSWETESLTLSLAGDGSSLLRLPKRCTQVTQVRTLNTSGTYTTHTTTYWRLKSSLYANGSKRLGELDYLETIQPLANWGYCWPTAANSVEVTGSFGWTTAPSDVKRAVALMCWDHFKPQRGDLRRASRVSTQDVTTEYLPPDPATGIFTGIPEVDDVIREYRRDLTVRVA
jgi:hypothetical protein